MKQLIKTWEDASTVIEEMKRIEKEYQDQGYETKRFMNCFQLVLDDGCVEIWWEDGCIWQEIKENKKMDNRNVDVLEIDDNGDVVGFGSHAAYDLYASEVMNGRGYYDANGHFHYYPYDMED